jgi:peptide-methionine (S)-S-oxide reductase
MNFNEFKKSKGINMSIHANSTKARNETIQAAFAAGCFWGVEELFFKTKGVLETFVGYSGGILKNPSYEQVCSGRTGHAETVLIEFDPTIISYDELLNVFWNNHNPTSINRQGPDVGTQYRSAIFYYNDEQKKLAEASRDKLNLKLAAFGKKVATEISPAGPFYTAEEYHQKYWQKHPGFGCHI